MTDEQITIYLDPLAHKSIVRDQRLFKTGVNKSEILKKIIINHYDKYELDINLLKQKVKETIIEESENRQFNEESYLNVAWKITKYLCEKPIKLNNRNKRHKDKIHLRINKKDSKLDFILNACPKNASESEYLVNIIYSYLNEPQYERERIIYKDIINVINEAIQNKQSIRIKTNTDKKNPKLNCKIQNVSPKEICISKEELYNYLLFQIYSEKSKGYYASTIHIHNIQDVHLDIEPAIFQQNVEEQFYKMKKNGVQFSINDDTVYKVKLSDKGKFLFSSRYLERPMALPESDEDNGVYYFNCSELQFKSYFAPFGKEVIVLQPERIRNDIVKEYEDVIHNYKDGV